jgi:ATP-dependent protease Clp ATPase subunit
VGRLEALEVLRDQLAEWLIEAPVDRRAALVSQYRATLLEIAELRPAEKTGDAVDEIAERRAARRSGGSAGSARSKRSG